MKKYLVALCLSAAAIAAPAQAETGSFAGAYAGGSVGFSTGYGESFIALGGFGGYNFQAGDKLTFGPEVGLGVGTKDAGFEFHFNGNVGYQVADTAEIFGGVGYQKFKNCCDGLMLQAGVNFLAGENLRIRPLIRTQEFDGFEFQIGAAFTF
jgi:hypothetical protein